ncbi:MAG: hypothetical protein ACRC1W_09835, partial [Shewanella sp.]
MNAQFIESLLTAYAEVYLSAWDNLRLVLSECAHHEYQARGFEVEFDFDHETDSGLLRYYWVQIGNVWLNCGRTNAYSVAMTRLTEDQLSRANTKNALECAILSQAQIGLLCM